MLALHRIMTLDAILTRSHHQWGGCVASGVGCECGCGITACCRGSVSDKQRARVRGQAPPPLHVIDATHAQLRVTCRLEGVLTPFRL